MRPAATSSEARNAEATRAPRASTTVGALRTVAPVAAAMTLLLVAFSTGYGYHRDELYFVAAAKHLAWGYADQGPLVPFIARAMNGIASGSLMLLRAPSAIAAGLTVALAGLIARELGGGRAAQLLAAACTACSAFALFTGHTLSTSTFDLLAWAAVTWIAIRAVRTGERRLWLAASVVLGLGLLNKPLPAFLAGGLAAGVAIAGPRKLLWTPHVWLGATIAAALWSPWIAWQAANGWPQLDVARSIAEGGSTSSEPWWAIVPFQALLGSPPLAPVWLIGLIALFRARRLRQFRFIAWAWAILAVAFMASGGKPYYLSGLLPALFAAGAVPIAEWLQRGRRRARTGLVATGVAVSGAVSIVITLPVLPPARASVVVALNPDVGETIGWPELARTVADVDHRAGNPGGAVILTENYGQAGALERYGPALHLPRVYSGHNAYADWGRPPDGSAPVIAIGLPPRVLADQLRACRGAGRVDNRAGIDNDERGTRIAICDGPVRPWSQEWPALRHLG